MKQLDTPQDADTLFDRSAQFYSFFYRSPFFEIGVQPQQKIVLGDKSAKHCRFCDRSSPAVTFKKVAHALPESMGNKSITIAYECDECNEKAGKTFENDFGAWSKPYRTFYQIRGKKGVPALKHEADGWRIEVGPHGFSVRQREDKPVFVFDETASTIVAKVTREKFTPIAVFRCFVKIALALLPDEELANFRSTLSWIRSKRSNRPFDASLATLLRTVVSGPRPFEGVTVGLFLRKNDYFEVPYATLVIAYGNECFQIFIPSREKDWYLMGRKFDLPVLLSPYHGMKYEFGRPVVEKIDLGGLDSVSGEIVTQSFRAEYKKDAG